MDRLYREVRLGIITPEMGAVLFGILTRILDSGLCDSDAAKQTASRRAKVHKIRPKLSELLTRTERAAWKRAVANAPGLLPPIRRPAKPASKAQPAAARKNDQAAETPDSAVLQFA
jgi:hypothetical protein